MHIDRFEYFCPDCKKKGVVTDVLLNADLAIIRGLCTHCNVRGAYKLVDRSKLKPENDWYTHLLGEIGTFGNGEATWFVMRFKIGGA